MGAWFGKLLGWSPPTTRGRVFDTTIVTVEGFMSEFIAVDGGSWAGSAGVGCYDIPVAQTFKSPGVTWAFVCTIGPAARRQVSTCAQRGLDFRWIRVELIGQGMQRDGDFAGRCINMPAAPDALPTLPDHLQDNPVRPMQMGRADVKCEMLANNHRCQPVRCTDSAPRYAKYDASLPRETVIVILPFASATTLLSVADGSTPPDAA